MSADLKIYCVRVNVDEEPSKELATALEMLMKHENMQTPSWISCEECLEVKVKDKTRIYLLDPFQGEAFEHLVELGCRVYGPPCVVSCLREKRPLPRLGLPLFSLSMKDVIISCTSIERNVREELHRMVEWMGGQVSRTLTETVSHLVSSEAGFTSKKYLVAGDLKMDVFGPDWVSAVWEASKERLCHATDREFEKYRLSMFKGCVLTASGLSAEEKQDIKNNLAKHGGLYTGEMRQHECTHLIINKPQGQKYTYACKWKVFIVTAQWFYDCVNKGYRCPEKHYKPVESGDRRATTSTPTKTAKEPAIPVDVSMINMTSEGTINETTVSNMTRLSEIDPLDCILYGAKKALFLDGCKIYVTGFNSSRMDKIRKVINSGGGTRFNQINDNVTHVLLGEERCTEDIQALSTMSNRPKIVSVSWLIASWKAGQALDGDEYCNVTLLDPSPQSPLPVKVTRPNARSTKQDDTLQEVVNLDNMDGDMHDILDQYIAQKGSTIPDMTDDSALVKAMDQEEAKMADEEDTLTENECRGIFSRKTFLIMGFERQDEDIFKKTITEFDGKVLQLNTRCIPDYAVVPLLGHPVEMTVREIVTNTWLQICIEEKKLLPVGMNPLFKPVSMATDEQILSGIVFSVSGYPSCERVCFEQLGTYMGATSQEYFSRKAMKNMLACTHLIVMEPKGSKYKAAKRWNVPILTGRWLIECAQAGRRLAEEDFVLENERDTSIVSNDTSRSDNDVRKDRTSSNQNEFIKPRVPEIRNLESSSVKEDVVLGRSGITPVTTHNRSRQRLELRATSEKVETPKLPSRTLYISDSTPTPTNARLRELKGVTPLDEPDTEEDTPSKYMAVGVKYKPPKLDLKDFLAAMASPSDSQRTKRARKPSTPMAVIIDRHLTLSMRNIAELERVKQAALEAEDEETSEEDDMIARPALSSLPLRGVVISVSKKLSKQGQYNNIAAELGADYRWTLDKMCTHFIFQGRANDKEYRIAKQEDIIIVSPHWLMACQDENTRVAESLYPYNYNPKLSLSVVSKKTPARSTRRSTRQSVKSSDLGIESDIVETRPPVAPSIVAIAQNDISAESAFKSADSISEDEMANLADEIEADVKRRSTSEEEKENGGSLQMKEALSRQMENIMAATKIPQGGKRLNKRLNSSGPSHSPITDPESSRSRPGSRQRKTQEGPASSRRSVRGQVVEVEQSQSCQVTWDDPTGRLEQEKLAQELQRACSPTQSSETISPGVDNHFSEPEDHEISFKAVPERNMSPDNEKNRTPTPEAPSIAFPIKDKSNGENPIEISLCEEEDDVDCTEVEESVARPPPAFLMSGISQQERVEYGAVLERLGALYIDSNNFDPRCTHLVVGTPVRNEKYLACLATGRWIVHKSYMEACRNECRFVDERDHEWGGPSTSKLLKGAKQKIIEQLGNAAMRWRVSLDEKRKAGTSCPRAFTDWNVILCSGKEREQGFIRLLEAGGATVSATKPPFTRLKGVTHAFIDKQKAPYEIDIAAIVKQDVPCLKPEYIAHYLMDQNPSMAEYYLDEMKDQWNSSGNRKRKASSASTPTKRKRERLH